MSSSTSYQLQAMFRVPLRRRLILLIFIGAFFVLAPAALFYSAGFRWNPKKGIVERNGTLIADTSPSGAAILLNGARLTDKTPVTLQNLAPGVYGVRFERDGYHTWDKTLEIRSELVTFVNNVWLWPKSEPEPMFQTSGTAMSLSPNQRLAAVWQSGKDAGLGIYKLNQERRNISISPAPVGNVSLIWNRDSDAVLFSDEKRSWLVSLGRNGATLLPRGRYLWSDGRLLGALDGETYEYAVASGLIHREKLPPGTVDVEDDFSLVAATSSDRLSVLRRSRPDRQFELPPGDWRFASRMEDWLFLKTAGARLIFDPNSDKPVAERLPADGEPEVVRRDDGVTLLSKNGGELWLMKLGNAPELLLRQSEPLAGAAWHHAGYDVIYATPRELKVLNLDPRNGRHETVLAVFDRIEAMAVARKYVYVLGSKNGKSGIWKVRLE